MSEKDKRDNAARKGRKAFYEGVPRDQNPMRARDSIMAWDDAWVQAKEGSERIQRHFDNKPRPCIHCGKPAIGSAICADCLEL